MLPDPLPPMDDDDVEAEQERLYRQWRAREVDVTPERSPGDALQRTEALRWLVLKMARELLSNPRVSMPASVRQELETLFDAESTAKQEAV